MITTHQLLFENAQNLTSLKNESIELVVTSPPYPMIQMWDELFVKFNPEISTLLEDCGLEAFEQMHQQLDLVWNELYRVLVPGGLACINIGDAVRTVNGKFSLYSNHMRILTHCQKLGFNILPAVLWRKPTNAPNKFMGSGMLPAGAYVTLEHEYILILRKGGKREFLTDEQKQFRNESAFFWEERNNWFSDVWFGIIGANQRLADATTRKRSAAFPFEIPYRLINMYSVKGDTVLDPFLGIGTTAQAAIVAGRNSVGIELNHEFAAIIQTENMNLVPFAKKQVSVRLQNHLDFVEKRSQEKSLKHQNQFYGFPVVTKQETNLLINELLTVNKASESIFEAVYAEEPQKEFCKK